MSLRAFHGDPAVKDKYLARVRAHREADEIVQGRSWENGRGCAVGCTIHGSDHSRYVTELGIPYALAKLQDLIFENLPLEDAKDFPVAFLESIPVGAELELLVHRWSIWIWTAPEFQVPEEFRSEEGRKAIEEVVKLHQEALDGSAPSRAAEAWAAEARAAEARAAEARAAEAWAAEAWAAEARAAEARAAEDASRLMRDKLLELLAAAPVSKALAPDAH